MAPFHSLLKRQLKQHFGSHEGIPESWRAFIDAVNDAYVQFDDDREMLERSLELSSQELLQANSETRAVLQAFPDLLFRLDPDGRILEYKSSRTRESYLPPQQFLGKRIQDLPMGDVSAKFSQAIRQVREHRTLVSIEYTLTIGGVESHYEARLLPLLDDQIISIVRDITERRRAEDRLRKSEAELREHRGHLEEMVHERTMRLTQVNQELRQEVADRKRAEEQLAGARDKAVESVRLKSAFLANMSHEIRTPLNIILGYGSLIGAHLSGSGDDTQEPLIDGVNRAGKRLLETIDGILDISKIESGAFEIRPVRVDLKAMLERQVRDFQPLAEEKGLFLSCRTTGAEAAVLFDSYCLSNALMNLLQNAIKFTHEGEIQVELDRDSEGCLYIGIRDTGIGIDPGFIPKLCRPFSQEDSGYTRRFEGSGLGLALTKNYLEMNRARLSVESEKGKGSLFRVQFSPDCELRGPRRVPERGSVVSAARSQPAEIEPRAVVLVVEDDIGTQSFMRTLLGRNFEVLTARSGEEARRQLSASDVHIILMDLSLKGDEDGLAVTRAIRADEGWKHIPVVAVTAHAFPEDRTRALAAGCDDYVAKPFDRSQLTSVIARLLTKGRGRTGEAPSGGTARSAGGKRS